MFSTWCLFIFYSWMSAILEAAEVHWYFWFKVFACHKLKTSISHAWWNYLDGRGDAEVNIVIYIVFTELRMHSGSYKGSFLHKLGNLFLRALKLNLSPKIQSDRIHSWWDWWQTSGNRRQFDIFGTLDKLKVLAYWNNKMTA